MKKFNLSLMYRTIYPALSRRLLAFWSQKSFLAYLLLPFSWLFQLISVGRTAWYVYVKKQASFPVPIIVVGNISLGGTGKTPLVAELVRYFEAQGYQPGIISRGYGGKFKGPMAIHSQSTPETVGDEPFLLAKKLQCPVIVGKKRVLGVQYLLQHFPQTNIVICDDGLQHYALGRDIEIITLDPDKRLGNGFCLPAGPLREPPCRLKKADFIINGLSQTNWQMEAKLGEMIYQVAAPGCTDLLEKFVGKQVHAVAGIGHPDRFFRMLSEKGINVIPHPFPDHFIYHKKDLQFSDNLPLLMTEKDAVKCVHIAPPQAWCVALTLTLPQAFTQQLLNKVIELGKVKHRG